MSLQHSPDITSKSLKKVIIKAIHILEKPLSSGSYEITKDDDIDYQLALSLLKRIGE